MEAGPLAQRCLQNMKQQTRCKFTLRLTSPRTASSRPISHFPARRKGCATRPTSSSSPSSPSSPPSIRPFSTSRYVRQDSSSQTQPSSSRPSTAPKPSILGDLTKKLRTQSSEYVPDKRPLAEQLDIFNWDIMDVMGSDPKKRPRSSAPSRRGGDDEGIDQEALYNNLAGAAYRQSDMPKVSLRLKPSLGRTQELDLTRNIDLTAAFRRVERRCTDNSVKVDARNQRIYVRRGQRRKDERRRRWRALFKEGFLHECARIRRMKKQGW